MGPSSGACNADFGRNTVGAVARIQQSNRVFRLAVECGRREIMGIPVANLPKRRIETQAEYGEVRPLGPIQESRLPDELPR